jgi:hypothetical protein
LLSPGRALQSDHPHGQPHSHHGAHSCSGERWWFPYRCDQPGPYFGGRLGCSRCPRSVASTSSPPSSARFRSYGPGGLKSPHLLQFLLLLRLLALLLLLPLAPLLLLLLTLQLLLLAPLLLLLLLTLQLLLLTLQLLLLTLQLLLPLPAAANCRLVASYLLAGCCFLLLLLLLHLTAGSVAELKLLARRRTVRRLKMCTTAAA